MTTRLSLVGLLMASWLCACSSDSSGSSGTAKLTDTTGTEFSVACSSVCTLTPTGSTLKPLSCDNQSSAADTFLLVFGAQILKVQALSVPAYGTIAISDAEPARPILCASDANCAPNLFSGSYRYTCQNQICQLDPATTMKTSDVIALCQADLPWPTSCPYMTDPLFASRMAKVAAVCGAKNACDSVPAECLQPNANGSPEPALDGGTGAATDDAAGVATDGAAGAAIDGPGVTIDGGT